MADQRLDGWKTIAAFLNRDVRTAKRWETSRRLPVHRMPGGDRARVWADPAELRDWMRGVPDEDASARNDRPATRYGRWAILALGALALLLAALAIFSADRAREPFAGDPASAQLFAEAQFSLNQRSEGAIRSAIAQYRALIVRRPDRPEGHAGLADSYLLLREFGTMPDAEAYAKARAAAGRALRIDQDSPMALRALGFVHFWHDGEPGEGLKLLKRAALAMPDDAQAQHWYANALGARASYAEAFRFYSRARVLSPGAPAIIADEAYYVYASGSRERGLRLLEQVARLHPGLASAHNYRASLLLLAGDDRLALDCMAAAARARGAMAQLASIERARHALAQSGRQAMLKVLTAATTTDYQRAQIAMIGGQHELARDKLALALASREPMLVGLPSDPVFVPQRDNPLFAQLFRRVERESL